MMEKRMKRVSRLSTLLTIGGLALLVVFLYTLLHETGHALVGLLFGGTLKSFSVSFWLLNAHVGLYGVFSDAQRSAISLAGVTLPLLIWGAFILSAPRKGNSTLEWLKVISSLGVINTLVAWIVLPLLYLVGQAPGDDVTSFLNTSHLSPLLVSGAALCAYSLGWMLFLSRTVPAQAGSWRGQKIIEDNSHQFGRST
jgi:hypothetical protein